MIIKIFLSGILLALGMACTPPSDREPETLTAEEQDHAQAPPLSNPASITLPSMQMLDISGNLVELTSLKGKKILVNLWASWCGPCKQEMPSLQKLYKDMDTSRVAFVMLALDNNFETSKKYINSQKFTFPVYYPARNLPPLFQVEGIPSTFIFNEKAELIQRVDGKEDYNTRGYRQLLK